MPMLRPHSAGQRVQVMNQVGSMLIRLAHARAAVPLMLPNVTSQRCSAQAVELIRQNDDLLVSAALAAAGVERWRLDWVVDGADKESETPYHTFGDAAVRALSSIHGRIVTAHKVVVLRRPSAVDPPQQSPRCLAVVARSAAARLAMVRSGFRGTGCTCKARRSRRRCRPQPRREGGRGGGECACVLLRGSHFMPRGVYVDLGISLVTSNSKDGLRRDATTLHGPTRHGESL